MYIIYIYIYIRTHTYIYIYMYMYIIEGTNHTWLAMLIYCYTSLSVRYAKAFGILMILQQKNANMDSLRTPFGPHSGRGKDSSATSSLKIWVALPPLMKKIFEQKNRKLTILTIFTRTTPFKYKLLVYDFF